MYSNITPLNKMLTEQSKFKINKDWRGEENDEKFRATVVNVKMARNHYKVKGCMKHTEIT
jgi:hypothetical protein